MGLSLIYNDNEFTKEWKAVLQEIYMHKSSRRSFIIGSTTGIIATSITSPALAASRSRIDSRVDTAMRELKSLGNRFSNLIDSSAGILMMPRIRRGGFGFGFYVV